MLLSLGSSPLSHTSHLHFPVFLISFGSQCPLTLSLIWAFALVTARARAARKGVTTTATPGTGGSFVTCLVVQDYLLHQSLNAFITYIGCQSRQLVHWTATMGSLDA